MRSSIPRSSAARPWRVRSKRHMDMLQVALAIDRSISGFHCWRGDGHGRPLNPASMRSPAQACSAGPSIIRSPAAAACLLCGYASWLPARAPRAPALQLPPRLLPSKHRTCFTKKGMVLMEEGDHLLRQIQLCNRGWGRRGGGQESVIGELVFL